MELEIRKLTPDLMNDYLHFFDHIAFTDHQEWSGCYCVAHHIHNERFLEDLPKGSLAIGRDYAIDFIKHGKLQGYLAYNSGEVVGWCNVNDRQNYESLEAWKELPGWKEVLSDWQKRIKSIMCFVIAPHMRGKGIATTMLGRICDDSLAEGCEFVEAYPYEGEQNTYNCTGHVAMYEKQGFTTLQKVEHLLVMRKHFGNK